MPDASTQTTISSVKKPAIKKRLCFGCKKPICSSCTICETRGCQYLGYYILNADQLQQYPQLLAKTQKIRGFNVLAMQCKLAVPTPWYVGYDDESVRKNGLTGIQQCKLFTGKNLMVRPAPLRPRHGFVESRPVDSVEEIEQIFAEARKHDPEAELLMMPFMKATYNAVITPSLLAFGPGHDGATAGRESISVPLSSVPFHELRPAIIRGAGIDPATEDPYVEAVLVGPGASDPSVYFTQLRAGAKVGGIREDYIPADTTVTAVVDADGDLVEWERKVQVGFPAGTVVSHVGGSLISHYAVHCMMHGVPILTSHKPRIGETLAKTAAVTALDPTAVAFGCGFGVAIPFGSASAALPAAAAAKMLLLLAHNGLAMTGNNGVWLGMAASLMLRLGMAASHGERRHGRELMSNHLGRETVYYDSHANFWKSRDTIGHTAWDFANLRWTSGYGGMKWHACTEATLKLEKTIRQLLAYRTEENVKLLVAALHGAINQAHNGGWWLDKFCSKSYFDWAAKQSLYAAMYAIKGLHVTHRHFAGFNKYDEAEAVIQQWAKLDDPPVTECIDTLVGFKEVTAEMKGQYEPQIEAEEQEDTPF